MSTPVFGLYVCVDVCIELHQILCGAGILAGGLDLYLNSTIITALYKVQILQSELFLISFLYSCKPMKLMLYQAPFAITEIDFETRPFSLPDHPTPLIRRR